ncbi:amino acid permease [Sphingomicrobium sp. XHP0239]|uniref:APC family permease n=1 Tax=Sphingomicrobium maritimum TaxID=3133972 RepID=UPI0031CC7F60
MSDQKEGELARNIAPAMLSVYALGTVLGAGIYVVIGKIIGEAGALAPFAFLVASFAAGLTAFSYAELATRVPESGGSAAFVARGFDTKWLTVSVAWAVIATGLVSAATIATGFVGYLGVFVDVSKWWSIPLLVGSLTIVAAIGIKQSAWFMGVTTAAGVFGLLYVLWFALPAAVDYPAALRSAWSGEGLDQGIGVAILLAAFLAFYSFIGFEDIVTLSEETEDQARAVPLAIFVALFVSLLFYVLVALAAVSVLDPATLNEAEAPLVEVVEARGQPGWLLGGVSLLIIVNGALAQIIMAARVVHDLGTRRGGAPSWLSDVNERTKTPILATVIAGGIVLALALFFPTASLARGTSFIILAVFAVANAALIAIKRRDDDQSGGIRKVPMWVPIGGLTASIALMVGQLVLGGGGE